MDREILFRGKKVVNGEWIEGDIHKNSDFSKAHIHPIGERVRSFDVIPETVGQYTGLCDKNGVKIFEGDIVKEFYPNCSIEDYRYDVGRVFYYKNMARFLRTSKRFPDCYADMTIDKTNSKCEVIGNIHDNPELLK